MLEGAKPDHVIANLFHNFVTATQIFIQRLLRRVETNQFSLYSQQRIIWLIETYQVIILDDVFVLLDQSIVSAEVRLIDDRATSLVVLNFGLLLHSNLYLNLLINYKLKILV